MSTPNFLETLENNSSYNYFFKDTFTSKEESSKSESTRKDSLFSPRTSSLKIKEYHYDTETSLK